MSRKFILLMFLFTFVASSALADDLRAPYWAGAPGSIYGIYNYDDGFPNGPGEGNQGATHEAGTVFSGSCTDPVCDYPEEGAAIPHASNEFPPEFTEAFDTTGAHQHFIQTWVNEGVFHEEYGGRQGVIETWGSCWELKNFTGSGTKRVRIQITFHEDSDTAMWAMGHIWGENDPFAADSDVWYDAWWDEWKIGLYDEEDPYFETEGTIEIGDGWLHMAFEYDLPTDNPGWEEFQFGIDGGVIYIDEVIIDTICYEGEEPPAGPGRVGAPQGVTEESPENEATGVHCDVNTVCFAPPSPWIGWYEGEANHPDPNFQGPFDYYVYFDVCEANVIDRISLVGTINDSADTEPCCVEVGLTEPGKTYYWAVDYNDQNDGGDPCLYEGPVYSFTKWGYALNPSPTDANEDIDPGQALTLTWENDGYAFDYDVSIWNEAETKSDSTTDLGTESWSPTIALALGETFLWQVQECNDWMGSELCVAGPVWTFTATLCETLDNFEGYANQTALEAVWKDYTDSGGDNAAEIAGLETNTVYEGAQSMKIGYFRTSLDPVGTQPEDYTWIVPSDANLARDGGKSVWVAYIADAAAGPSDARSERLWMGFDDGANTDVILYPGESDDANGWSIFFVALSETTNSDETSIDKIMLGMTGDGTGGAVDTSVYFDLLVRCGAVCPFDYGYPDAVAGSFAPSYTKLYADIAGPFREFINAEGETEGPDCAVDGYDIGPMIDAWLSEDILGVKPSDSNLIVEYLFDVCAPLDDLYDSSGNANHGVEVNDVNTHDGIMTLDGNDWVIVPISDINLFYGDKPWSIAVDYNNMALEQGVLFSSSDVCGWGAHHIVPEYYEGEEVAVSLQIVEGGDSWGATPFYERANHSIVVTYDPDREEENAWVYIDAVQGDYPTEVVPPDPCDPGTQIIGWTVINPDNLEDAWFMDRFVGDIDNFRIYDYALDLEGIVGLLPTGEFHLSDYLDPNPNLEVDGAFPANIINFLDHAKYGDDWGKVKPFE